VVLEVQQRQAVAALRGGQVKAAVELLEAGRTAKQALLLPSSPARATGLEALTEAYAAQGRVDDALACWEEAAKIQVRSTGGEETGRGDVWMKSNGFTWLIAAASIRVHGLVPLAGAS
jgi:tetratricopeptide (TPR) repeat protein